MATHATGGVLRQLRRTAERSIRPRTYTRHAHLRITAAARFLTWLAERGTNLTNAAQADIDEWLANGPGSVTGATETHKGNAG